MRDPAGAPGPLEDAGGVVPPLDRLRDPPAGDGLRPGHVKVGVGGVIHHVDRARAGRPGADLAEHHLAVGLAVPLHVGEPVPESERVQDRGTERPAAAEIGHVQVTQRRGGGADPLMHLDGQRARAVPADVLEQHPPVRADGVVGEFLGLDELLDAHLRHVPEHRQDGIEVGGRVDPVGIGRAGAVDRLDDEREADALGRGPDARDRLGGGVPRRAQPGRIEQLLHPLLVPEGHGLGHRQPGQAKLLAQPRGEDHVRLPQALHPVDAHLPGQLANGPRDGVLRRQRADRDVVRERAGRDGRKGRDRLVPHADDR